MSHPLPEHHEVLLKSLMRIEPESELPENVIELYNELRRAMRICGAFVNENQLILIPVLLNRVVRPEAENFIDVIQSKKVARNDVVVAKWRGQWHFGRYVTHDVKRKKIRVILDDATAEEREISAGEVRLPTESELVVLGQ